MKIRGFKITAGQVAVALSVVALFVALGGGAIAKKKKKAPALKNGSVTTPKLADGAVTTPKLGDGAVTAAKLAAGSVGGGKLGAIIDVPGTLTLAADAGANTGAVVGDA